MVSDIVTYKHGLQYCFVCVRIGGWALPGAVGVAVADGAVLSGGGVVVAAWTGRGKLSQDVLGLVECHETHSSQRETDHKTPQ